MTTLNRSETAEALYGLRLTLNAVRAMLSEDPIIAHPIPEYRVNHTGTYNELLAASKIHAKPLLIAAHQNAMDFLGANYGRFDSEAGALAGAIKDSIEWAFGCLYRHGDIPSNPDRQAASFSIQMAWQLSALAIRLFAMEEDVRNTLGEQQ